MTSKATIDENLQKRKPNTMKKYLEGSKLKYKKYYYFTMAYVIALLIIN